ncbi:hypothetical protein [Fibrobacter sp.]
MNLKKLALALSLTAAFTYMGCEDSTSAPATGGDDQPTLSSSSAGDEGGEPAASSASTGDEGGEPAAASSDAKAESAGSGDVPPASSADVGPGPIPGIDSSFVFDSTAIADMMKCDEEGATQNQMGIKMTCTDGQWAVDSSSIADMMKCEAGETREQMGMVMKCEDGHWALDSAATAAANTCDEEGATKTETMDMGGAYSMEMTYICTDGKWEMQMPDFGGMFGGDSTGGFPGGGNFNFGDSSFTMPGGGQGGFPGGGNFGGGEIPVPGPVETAQEE